MSHHSSGNYQYPCCRTVADKKQLHKTEACRVGWNNPDSCKYGKRCRFAHSADELRERPTCIHYQTKLCKNFEKDGNCPYGFRCRFIHREAEPENRVYPKTDALILPMEKTSFHVAETAYKAWVRHGTGESPALGNSKLINCWTKSASSDED